MELNNQDYEVHSFYNLSRYLFLKIERDYNSIVEKSGITLPQLRVLWIINSFPGITPGRISEIGCWTNPTVTNIIKKLILKKLIIVNSHSNKKYKKTNLTESGFKMIEFNKQSKGSSFPIVKLIHTIKEEELCSLILMYRYLADKCGYSLIFDYIDKLNELSLKIRYDSFDCGEQRTLKNLIALYNLLRVFVLTVENSHSILLKNMDLTYPQLRALKIISAYSGITSLELSKIALWSPSSANLVVKNLYTKGLIYKNKGTVKNSLHIFANEKVKLMLNSDAVNNEASIIPIKILKSFKSDMLNCLNGYLLSLNLSLDNTMVRDYIIRTYKI